MPDDDPVLNDIIGYLTCPVCRADLTLATPLAGSTGASLRCPAGHLFDVARQGYVNLLSGGARPGTADTAEMVRARADFLGAGHFAEVVGVLADRVRALSLPPDGCVLDAGAGTGHHLAAVLDRSPDAVGIAMDLSKHALRRAAVAHARIGAVGCDLWRAIPVRDRSMAVVTNVFAPRNAVEFHRVLRPDGALIVVAPTARHLSGLVETLGLLSVDERKAERIAETLGGHFRLDSHEVCELRLNLTHDEVLTLVGMGPNAWHIGPEELTARLVALPDPAPVPVSFALSVFRPLP